MSRGGRLARLEEAIGPGEDQSEMCLKCRELRTPGTIRRVLTELQARIRERGPDERTEAEQREDFAKIMASRTPCPGCGHLWA